MNVVIIQDEEVLDLIYCFIFLLFSGRISREVLLVPCLLPNGRCTNGPVSGKCDVTSHVGIWSSHIMRRMYVYARGIILTPQPYE